MRCDDTALGAIPAEKEREREREPRENREGKQ